MRDGDELLEWAEVHGNYYGTPREPVETALAAGRDMLFDIDWQGTQQLYAKMRDDVVSVFVLPPSAGRAEACGWSGAPRISARSSPAVCRNAAEEIPHWAEYDYVLVNRDLDKSFMRLRAILTAERLKRVLMPNLRASSRSCWRSCGKWVEASARPRSGIETSAWAAYSATDRASSCERNDADHIDNNKSAIINRHTVDHALNARVPLRRGACWKLQLASWRKRHQKLNPCFRGLHWGAGMRRLGKLRPQFQLLLATLFLGVPSQTLALEEQLLSKGGDAGYAFIEKFRRFIARKAQVTAAASIFQNARRCIGACGGSCSATRCPSLALPKCAAAFRPNSNCQASIGC